MVAVSLKKKQVKVILGGQYGNLSRFDNELNYLNKFYGTPYSAD